MTRALALLSLLAACGTPDANKSIELMNEGVELFNAGDGSTAIRKFEDATRIYGDNHRAWYNLGQAHDAASDFDKAAEAFQEAVKLDGSDPMYQYRLGKALHLAGKHDKAQTHLEKAVKQNARLYKAHYFLGKVYMAQDKPREAAQAYTESAQANPAWGPPFNALGTLYIVWDKLPEAIKVLENGVVNVRLAEELSEVYYHLGFAYQKQNNLDKAIEAYSSAIDKRPGNLDATLQRGMAYRDKGDFNKAKRDLEKFVKSGGGNKAFELQAANVVLMQMAMRQ